MLNPNDSSAIGVQTLLGFWQESDAVQVITEKLRVKEMGPSDCIRAKHEVKASIESGDAKAAEALIKQASERIAIQQTVANRITEQQQRGQQIAE